MFDRAQSTIANVDPEVFAAIEQENRRQEEHIELIASENYTSPAVMAAQGSQLTNKYAEGYPGKRYYGGCEYVDVVEQLAIDRVKQLFGAEAANVQPNSGSQANQGVFFAMLKPGDTIMGIKPGDTIMGMSLAHGGHLTHGSPVNMSGKWFNVVSYGLNENEDIDYEAAEKLAQEHKPKLIVAGASAFALKIDFERLAKIAKSVGAYLMVDMAHYAGLIAAGVYPNPVPHADFVTTTTHKSLRGPRGGVILMKAEYEKQINSAIFPGIQGGPLMHVIAAKAVAFKEALSPEVKAYQQKVVERPCAGRDARQARPADRVGPHRKPRDAGRPACEEHHRQGSGSRAGRRAHHREQERDSERSGKAVRDERHSSGLAGDDHARLRPGRSGAGRQPDRRRAREPGRRSDDRARARTGRRADQALPGLPLIDDALPVLPARRHAGS